MLPYILFPPPDRCTAQRQPTRPPNGAIKRDAGIVGIFPIEDAITRVASALPLEEADKRAVSRGRYMTPGNATQWDDDTAVTLPSVTARPMPARPAINTATPPKLHHPAGHDRPFSNCAGLHK